MSRKRSLIVAVVAYAALMLPMLRLEGFIDALLCLLFARLGCVNVPLSIHLRALTAAYDAFGATGCFWVSQLFPFVLALVPTVFIYRYVRRRDFDGICADCAAHLKTAWTLLVLFVIFAIAAPRMSSGYVGAAESAVSDDEVEMMEEMCEDLDPVRLELCLCHPDTEALTKSLVSDGGTISTQAIAAAQSVEGCRLMMREEDGKILEAVYVSEKAELTECDLESAFVERDPMVGCYWVGGVLKPDAARRFKELTSAYKPWGKKNSRANGRQLAILVNGRLVTAPVIQAEIGAKFLFTGNFTREEAMKLAASLNRASKQQTYNDRDEDLSL